MDGNALAREPGNAVEQFALAALRSQSLSGCLSRHCLDGAGMDPRLALFRVWLEWLGGRPSRHLADDPNGGIHWRRGRDVLRCIFKLHSGDNGTPDMGGNPQPDHATALRSDSHNGRIGRYFRLRSERGAKPTADPAAARRPSTGERTASREI